MDIIDALILGSLQGMTEFLPVSSSGHLVLGQHFLGLSLPGNFFEVLVHLGTLCSVLVVFRTEILKLIQSIKSAESKIMLSALVIGTIPAVLIGLSMKDKISQLFENPLAVSFSLILTGIWLVMTKWFVNQQSNINLKNGFLIGCAQAIAIIPGISRSGATIGVAMLLGISPEKAAKFSFLLAIPAIAGAGLLTAIDIDPALVSSLSSGTIIAAFFSSFLVGWAALTWLLKLISKGQFHWFGLYCMVIGILTLSI
ncbi:MAG: undecaprenyl-diphosphate phosphatase [Candidatus Marinimicrobia bacterium]|jgi:undecaprenyl-diphosphatase|nr:undecaprenyl-diphosphate phosphatase [Candidatus Neomarinimicrobiota bacterium]MDP7094902.1 undecaprenyl-diphosphate phosphatase [Candidatus Neomarinimicrobiota bacterium]MDP7512856.1 undecaprenyl-diphosphate phosphatase [Candidatus Neomarinimicrobiota bacterium]|tara:strand:- start:16 stop:780 length:765 start_codon:yes stop_codon:yes gene_type:complete